MTTDAAHDAAAAADHTAGVWPLYDEEPTGRQGLLGFGWAYVGNAGSGGPTESCRYCPAR